MIKNNLERLKMILLSHGLDSITLKFNNRNYSNDDLRLLCSIINGMKQDNDRRIRNGGSKSLFTKHVSVRSKFPVKINIDKVEYIATVEYATIRFSLATLLYGSNVKPLELSDVPLAIKKLEDRLDFDCSKAHIYRVDYNFNVGTSLFPLTIWEHIHPGTDNLLKCQYSTKAGKHDSSIEIGNKSRKLVCYSQTNNPRYSDSDHQFLSYLIEKYNLNDVIRYEFRFFEDNLHNPENGSKRFTFSELQNDSFQKYLAIEIVKFSQGVNYTDPEFKVSENENAFEFLNQSDITKNDIMIQFIAKLMDSMSFDDLNKTINEFSFKSDHHYSKSKELIEQAYEIRKKTFGTHSSISQLPILFRKGLSDSDLLSVDPGEV
jgi:hypothetical protein